jgi:hypothetical protein
MGIEREGFEMVRVAERTQAMVSYARTFFRSVDSEDFGRMIEDARSLGQQLMVERLYSRKVIDNVVRTILGRIDKGHCVGDQLDDYVQDATVVLIQVARQEKLDLTKSAGEIASYICLWIEQRVKRMARKDQRWRFSLSETTDDVEELAGSVAVEEVGLTGWNPEWPGGHSPPDPGMEAGHVSMPWRKTAVSEKNGSAATFSARKSERNVLSIFGSSRSEDM